MKLRIISDQVIVITGATSGIGLTTARIAVQQGAKVVLAARNEEALQQLCEELNRDTHGNIKAIYVVADVGNIDEVKHIAERAVEQFSRFDTWVNNAGISIFGRNEEVSLEDQLRLFQTNYWGVVHGSLTAIPYLKKWGGALINVGSEVSDRAVPLQGAYSASKHAVKGFTDSLRMELEEERAPVSVTLIKPAAIDTLFTKHAKNYMNVEPVLPPPLYAPELVAQAILSAAQTSQRDIFVGAAAKMISCGAYHMPRATDKYMEKFMFKQQRSNVPSDPARADALYSPLPGTELRERQGYPGKVHESCTYTSINLHPKITRALLVGSGALLAAWCLSRRSPAQ